MQPGDKDGLERVVYLAGTKGSNPVPLQRRVGDELTQARRNLKYWTRDTWHLSWRFASR
jgi:hypothetical protein